MTQNLISFINISLRYIVYGILCYSPCDSVINIVFNIVILNVYAIYSWEF